MQHIRFGETHEQENLTAALKAKNQTISNRNTREEENNIDNNNKMKKETHTISEAISATVPGMVRKREGDRRAMASGWAEGVRR